MLEPLRSELHVPGPQVRRESIPARSRARTPSSTMHVNISIIITIISSSSSSVTMMIIVYAVPSESKVHPLSIAAVASLRSTRGHLSRSRRGIRPSCRTRKSTSRCSASSPTTRTSRSSRTSARASCARLGSDGSG